LPGSVLRQPWNKPPAFDGGNPILSFPNPCTSPLVAKPIHGVP
jgi:hypothetical protein